MNSMQQLIPRALADESSQCAHKINNITFKYRRINDVFSIVPLKHYTEYL